MTNQNKNILIWLAIILSAALLFNTIQGNGLGGARQNLSFSEFLNKIDEKQIQDIKIYDRLIEGHLSDGTAFSTYAMNYPDLVPKLRESGAQIEIVPPDSRISYYVQMLLSSLPMLIIIGLSISFMRQMQGGSGRALGFGKSKAKLVSDKGPKVTFKDVAGIEEAKDELFEIVDFLRDPSKFQKLGGRIPKGCLLIGSPGTGKTLLAKAIAGEANVPFFSISGSEFVEMFVGVGASRVRDLFEQGKRNAPCIIFIDEIDAVGRHRGIGLGGGNDEREQTLNQMLVEMDGFEANEGVVIIAATNRPDVLDPALLRPGRFDRQITVPNPDINGREQILKVHLRRIKCVESIVPRTIARGTPGFSGAELANLVNEAALLAARKDKKLVDMEDLEAAKDKVLMGVERRSMAMTDDEKTLTAYHEAGHAIVALHSKASDPIHKATIIPRGNALGMVMKLPVDDRINSTKEQLESNIAVAMGGRVAEEIIFGKDKVTTGAYSDIKGATNIARSMVTVLGLSEKLGLIHYGGNSEGAYSRGSNKEYSDNTSDLIDSEIKRIVQEGYDFAKKVLTENLKDFHKLAKGLLEHETLSGAQINNLLADKPLDDPYGAEILPDKKKGHEIIIDGVSLINTPEEPKLPKASGKSKPTDDSKKE